MMRKNLYRVICCYALLLSLMHPAALAKVKHCMLPMTDGTRIATDIHTPDRGQGPWPVILIRSAYSRNQDVGRFLKEDYTAVVQDLRGMGTSEGEPHVYYADGWREDQHDGADTVFWIKAQPWCNGKIATYGASALGMSQFLIAPATQEITCQCISVAPASFYSDALYHGGVFRKNLVEGWLTALAQPHIIPIYKGAPYEGEFWSFYNATARVADITAPALFEGGWYDIFQKGALDGFTAREAQGAPGARGKNYLIMDWTPHHGNVPVAWKPKARNDYISVSKLRRAFLAYYLKGEAQALEGMPKVQYQVMGADTPGAPGNCWRTADQWPPFPTEENPFYLSATGSLQTQAPQADKASLAFSYDPQDPYPTHGGANLFFNIPSGPQDQRKYSSVRKDFLALKSAPLEEALEVTGRVRVKLYVSTDVLDTDFSAKLLDIYPEPDGREINLLDGIQRVKLRESLEKPLAPLSGPDEIVDLEIDLWSTSHILAPGHCIGLHISGGNYPRFEINPNTGKDYAVDGETMPIAHNRVYMDAAHPSALILPKKKQ